MAMQKLYQTFVAQAAQLQSVHENVKVSFFFFFFHKLRLKTWYLYNVCCLISTQIVVKAKYLLYTHGHHIDVIIFLLCVLQILKHQYLSYRRAFLEDSTDVFESKRASSRKWQNAPRVTTGPAPFSSVPNAAAVAMAATLTQQQQPTPGLTAYKF